MVTERTLGLPANNKTGKLIIMKAAIKKWFILPLWLLMCNLLSFVKYGSLL